MLSLKNITKVYKTEALTQTALKNVNINFRQNEFVSVLGPSGSGKTTLLNIIGGLDKYTQGDLIIKGVSTKYYKSRNWDSYRNGFIGFVFQSYNLIPQSTVLKNVELALTISGVPKKERKARALEALEKVGLKDHKNKKPNQLSGGQMQRVAIARALVNNPEILLADEPTGALDSTTSVQIMELLKEIAKDKLVIMVTHNPKLAQDYSTRIIELLDGEIKSDSNPCTDEEIFAEESAEKTSEELKTENKENKENKEIKENQSNTPNDKNLNKENTSGNSGENTSGNTNKNSNKEYSKAFAKAFNKASKKASKKVSMGFLTALELSFQNLKTKKGRTLLTSFAGSIGIIGIALILALSNGMSAYIEKVETDTLSSYPLSIQSNAVDFSSSKEIMEEMQNKETHNDNKIHQKGFVGTTLKTQTLTTKNNNLYEFKKYLESSKGNTIKENVSSIKYGYDLNLQVFSQKDSGKILKINPSELENKNEMMSSAKSMWASMGVTTETWTEMINNQELLESQYSLVTGSFPKNADEIVVIVNKDNEISDQTLYTLGLKDQDEFNEIKKKIENGEEVKKEDYKKASFTYSQILNTSFKIIPNSKLYKKVNNVWVDKSQDEEYIKEQYKNALALKVVGIIKPNNTSSGDTLAAIGYTEGLTKLLINTENQSEIVKQQKENKNINVFTGTEFLDVSNMSDEELINILPQKTKATLAALSESERELYLKSLKTQMNATAETNLNTLGAFDYNKPSSVNLYLKDFDAREIVTDEIAKYNSLKGKEKEEYKIEYTDFIGIMISNVNKVINMITYLLIGFVSISLVVSSIMIGIITYISVLERTKEIGILRSLGASKFNVSNVFIAETAIVGFFSGVLGIGISLLLTVPANLIIKNLSGVNNIAVLPAEGAIILIVLSTILTVIAGLIPARLAAKKDPVIALRSE